MRIKYRLRNSATWKDIPNIEMPISIVDTCDETFDNIKFSFIVASDYVDFNELVNMTPKTYIMFTDTDLDADITENNTYYFITTRTPNARIRKEVKNDTNVITTNALWQVEITAMELIKELEDTEMPNYTITQPKTQFFNRYRRVLVDRYGFNQKYSYSTTGKVSLSSTSKQTINSSNNTNEITTTNTLGDISIRLNKITNESYTIKSSVSLQRTSSGKGNDGYLYALESESSKLFDQDTSVLITSKFYTNLDALITTQIKSINLEHYVSATTITTDGVFILGLGSEVFFNFEASVDKMANASYCITTLTLTKNKVIKNYNNIQGTLGLSPTSISGFTNDEYVKATFKSFELEIVSNQLTDALTEPKYTLLSFIDKALYDYNFNRRNKLTLSNDAKVILNVFAKESEWSGYNFRELLTRAFKYVKAIPYITINREITYIKTTNVDTQFEIKNFEENANSRNDEDYYDMATSVSKNLISDDDFTTENVVIGSGSDEFSQLTDDNAGFLLNNAIYYISSAKLYAPNLSFPIVAGGTTRTINSNIGVQYYWDITERIVDKNLYKSLPNVNFSSVLGRTSGFLGQGNTISFTSGSRFIDNACKQAPDIPTFSPISGNMQISQYAIVELLICLAHEYIMANYGNVPADFSPFNPSSNITLTHIKNFELEIIFVPYHKEITTKYVSDKNDRAGLNYQKRLNVSDRTIDYKENELVLRNEMNRKGNIQKTISQKYNNIGETIVSGGIINDGDFTITSKRLLINKNMVECEYSLDSEFISQNTDVGLSVEYDRYNVPYEYVNREIMIHNHLIFSKISTNQFDYEPIGCTIEFLQDVYTKNIGNDTTLDKQIYADMRITHEDNTNIFPFIKMNKLTSRFSMILSGSFIDNYSAGSQKYFNGDSVFLQPFRYCDYRGRVLTISDISIGYSPNRLYRIDDDYDLDKFPDTDGYILERAIFNEQDDFLYDKDAREGVSLNYHTFLESLDSDIRFYGFNTINAFGTLYDDVELTDNLTIEDVPYTNWAGITIGISFSQVANNGFSIIINIPTQDIVAENIDLTKGIVLANSDGKSFDLVGIIKNPTITTTPISTSITAYIYSTRYGKK